MIPLHRLIKPRDAEALLGEFQSLMPDADLSLVGADGRCVAGSDRWPPDDVTRWLARARDGAPVDIDGLLFHPLRARDELAGALVARRLGRDRASQDLTLDALQRSLDLLLSYALEKRDVANEALDRYREVNLLYAVSETLAARLDSSEIAGLVLREASRIIHTDAALVLLPTPDNADDLREQSRSGQADVVDALAHIAGDAIQRVRQTGRPSIVTDLPDSPIPIGAILCAPLRTQERICGIVLMGRLKGRLVFTAGEEKLLMALSGQAAIALETARLHQEEIQRQRLEEELAVGRNIQLSLLPEKGPSVPGWEFATYYQAARQVGGDLYDFFKLSTDWLGLLIADVTGKGLPSALFMAVCRTIIRIAAMSGANPAEVLSRANRFIAQETRSGLLLSAFYATLDTRSGRLAYANGGHNWPIWYDSRSKECRELAAHGIVLGALDDISPEEREVVVRPGDLLVFFTDGVTEARRADGNLFEDERLRETIVAHRHESAEQVLQAVVGAVQDFIGDTLPSDDLTLFVIRRLSAGR